MPADSGPEGSIGRQGVLFEQTHPARKLIDLLTRSSVGRDQAKGRDDPLYRTIARNVDRVQGFNSEIAMFQEVVDDLEAYLD